jgi:AraC-like DNA-binding protein
MVAGPTTRARTHYADPGPWCMQLRLRPGNLLPGLPPVAELVDRIVPWSGESRLTIADKSRADLIVLREAIEHLRSGATVHSAARAVHVSERHLRDPFVEMTGLSPKRRLNVERLRVAIQRLAKTDLAAIAVEAGFYDQAHMTRAFRRATGATAGAYARGVRPLPSPCRAEGRPTARAALAGSDALRNEGHRRPPPSPRGDRPHR